MQVKEYINKIQNNEIDLVEHTYKVLEECKKINNEYNYFNVISEELAIEQARELKSEIIENRKKNKKISKRLLGVPVSVKDSICVKNVESSAGSAILKGYKPLFNATAVENAINQGAIIIGKTSQDEFGFGSFSVNVGLGFKIPKNPVDKERTCGGSSGGAAGLSKIVSFPHIALGESTGGSIALPSSFCGVFGLCPTYGLVSRYGLIDFGNSLDKIGPIGKSCFDVGLMLETISGYDNKDSTSLNIPSQIYTDLNSKKKLRIGVIKEGFGKGTDDNVQKCVQEGIKKIKDNGIKCEEISLTIPIKYGIPAYYMIGTSEASTNLAKFCGIRYGTEEQLEGTFNEYFTKIRSNNLGAEAKRRIILGTFARMSGFRDAYYIKAMKVRTLMIREYKKAFKKFDVLVSPTSPVLPPKLKEIEKLTPLENYMMDILLVGPNICGLPHLSVPVGNVNNLPVGMLLIGDHLNEKILLKLGKMVEKYIEN